MYEDFTLGIRIPLRVTAKLSFRRDVVVGEGEEGLFAGNRNHRKLEVSNRDV